MRSRVCITDDMTDEHYNQPGKLPEPLEDEEPTDLPATKWIFISVLVVSAIAIVWMAFLHDKGQ